MAWTEPEAYDPALFREKLNAEHRTFNEYRETCQCRRPVAGSTYGGHKHCAVCKGRMRVERTRT